MASSWNEKDVFGRRHFSLEGQAGLGAVARAQLALLQTTGHGGKRQMRGRGPGTRVGRGVGEGDTVGAQCGDRRHLWSPEAGTDARGSRRAAQLGG